METICKLLSRHSICDIYNAKPINNKQYTRECVTWLCDNFEIWTENLTNRDVFKKGRAEVGKKYLVGDHDGIAHLYTNRREEILCYSLVNADKDASSTDHPTAHFGIGRFIGYQIPMKAKQSREKIGKAIDALTYDSSTSTIYIVEAKGVKSQETLLRCLTEAFTYALSVNKTQLVDEICPGLNHQEIRLSFATLFFKGAKVGGTEIKASQASLDYNTPDSFKLLTPLIKKMQDYLTSEINDGQRTEIKFIECDPVADCYKPIYIHQRKFQQNIS